MTRESAETLAIQALTYLGEEPERLHRFLALSGIGPESLRDAACEPHFLLGVLDHLVGDDTLLQAFSGEARLSPQSIVTPVEVPRSSLEHDLPLLRVPGEITINQRPNGWRSAGGRTKSPAPQRNSTRTLNRSLLNSA